ncbi:hypothetical protein [Limnohabitans sp. 63ED37-2]|uniref:hypothetical protein n=1 Tax=Limnohabitans sp. 63ED37-2 TaxID=1678128 RepID=UPI0012E18C30|nr:hypothetical protein [Limnohabitans sp. 63ED37-2]
MNPPIDITKNLVEINPYNIEFFDLAKEIEKSEIDLGVMDDVFIVGFPLKTKTTPNCYPIYKGATIASEPFQYTDLPIFYIDGKTKKGMSGSPVIKKHKFDLKILNGKMTGTKDRIDLIGTYSGRDTTAEDEYTAELGIVWHANKTLLQIIEQQNPASDSTAPKPSPAA